MVWNQLSRPAILLLDTAMPRPMRPLPCQSLQRQIVWPFFFSSKSVRWDEMELSFRRLRYSDSAMDAQILYNRGQNLPSVQFFLTLFSCEATSDSDQLSRQGTLPALSIEASYVRPLPSASGCCFP